MTDQDDDLGPIETLRFLADLIEQSKQRGTFVVQILPEGLRAIADNLTEMLQDAIVINSQSGEQLALISGEEATNILHLAVRDYIIQALQRSMQNELLQQEEQHDVS